MPMFYPKATGGVVKLNNLAKVSTQTHKGQLSLWIGQCCPTLAKINCLSVHYL